MFPLDGLFEGLIRSVVARALAGTSRRLRASKNAGRLLRRTADQHEVLRLEPDLIIDEVDLQVPVLVGDAKWKRLDLGRSDLGMAQADAYQVVTYLERLQLQRAAIIYPTAAKGDELLTKHPFIVQPSGARLTVIQVDVQALLDRTAAGRSKVDAALRTLVDGLVTD